MNEPLETIANWLADYYLLSSVLLAFAFAVLATNTAAGTTPRPCPIGRRRIVPTGCVARVPGWSTVSLLTYRQQAMYAGRAA